MLLWLSVLTTGLIIQSGVPIYLCIYNLIATYNAILYKYNMYLPLITFFEIPQNGRAKLLF